MIQCEQRRQCLQKTFNKQIREHNATKEAIKLNNAKWLKARTEKDEANTKKVGRSSD
jgi:hypothetical protein